MTQREFLQLVAENYPGIESVLPFYCSCHSHCLPTPTPPVTPNCKQVYGSFVAQGTLNTQAGNAINFTTQNALGPISISNGAITLQCPGTYLVTYSLNLPTSSTLTTTLNLAVGGTPVAGTQVAVNKTDTNSSSTVYGQAIINVCNVPTTLQLNTSNAINLTGDYTNDVLGSLNVVKL